MKTNSPKLLQALNASSAMLQRSAHSQAEVFAAFRDELARLGLRGGLSLLDESGQQLVIRTTVRPEWMVKALERLEKLTGYKTQNYAFAIDQVAVYRQAMQTRQAIFAPDSSVIIRELLPDPVRPLAGIILRTLGAPPGIYAPLNSQDHAFGVLNVVGKELTQEDIPAVEAFANHIVIALENANLFANLRASEDKFSKAFRTSPDPVNINRLSDGLYLEINQGFTKITGFTLEDVRGKTSSEINIWVDPNDRARLVKELQEHGEVENLEAQFRSKNGQIITGLMSARIIQIGNEPCVLSITRDITERKQAEQEREKLIRELETRNAELERFLYIVSHDLKSPIITIQGFLGYIQEDSRTGNLERLNIDMVRITEATKKMTRLLNELLELSRIGRLMNPPEDVPFNEIVSDAIELMQKRLTGGNIRIIVAENLPIVRGDRARLVEVAQNLIDNAAKFMGDQSYPCIEIGMRGTDRDDNSIFFVRDNGIGIDSKYHDNIFGLFNKLDAQTEGTGIGLAIVKRIVEVHGGRIWVESDGLGKGSTFCFTIPDSRKTV